MSNFTIVELMNMVLAYGVVGGNVIQEQILYREQLPFSRQGCTYQIKKTFTSPVQWLRDRKVQPKNGRSRMVEPEVP
jgi:hypothetical protein